ncbi:MAG: acetylxylan esterase [Clostridia bacterium]|nr:acetylxylan esterase [Clostridia bacterium]
MTKINYESIQLELSNGALQRTRYYEGVCALIDEKAKQASKKRDVYCSADQMAEKREKYRAEYISMLGWPLTEYRSVTNIAVEKELLEEIENLKIYRLSLETLPGVWFQGLLYVPHERDKKAPLVILHPGGGYRVEELIKCNHYSAEGYQNIGGRALERGAVVYAPQLMVWTHEESGVHQPTTRQFLDVKLKAMGGSLAALEIFNVRRAIDYLIANEPIDPKRIGAAGLSYGGFYTMYLAAAEPRVKSVFSSCFFHDRFGERKAAGQCRSDWLWQNSANCFFDAEVAALIAPRALYIENGDQDELFPAEESLTEWERLKPFYEAAGATEKLLYHHGAFGHCVAESDLGFAFFIKHLFESL